jgi:hypothetical protein
MYNKITNYVYVMLYVVQNKVTSDVALQQKLTKLAKQALERAEILKGITNKSIETPLPSAPSPPTTPPAPRSVRTSGLQSIPEKDTNSSPTEGMLFNIASTTEKTTIPLHDLSDDILLSILQ